MNHGDAASDGRNALAQRQPLVPSMAVSQEHMVPHVPSSWGGPVALGAARAPDLVHGDRVREDSESISAAPVAHVSQKQPLYIVTTQKQQQHSESATLLQNTAPLQEVDGWPTVQRPPQLQSPPLQRATAGALPVDSGSLKRADNGNTEGLPGPIPPIGSQGCSQMPVADGAICDSPQEYSGSQIQEPARARANDTSDAALPSYKLQRSIHVGNSVPAQLPAHADVLDCVEGLVAWMSRSESKVNAAVMRLLFYRVDIMEGTCYDNGDALLNCFGMHVSVKCPSRYPNSSPMHLRVPLVCMLEAAEQWQDVHYFYFCYNCRCRHCCNGDTVT